ncbi:WXG100 family type VII secretion target [Actinoplanes sp. NPDC049265]|uniref:WXG100 family type VII secretion target n=1 Tax=Actinoplanes sp. NPDC049265 TaxID=3363902 RepID=UPI0037248FCB
MGLSQIEVTPQMITAGANDCRTTAGDIDQALAKLKTYVMDVQARWHGIASDQFDQLMHDFDVYGRMLHDSLTDIGQGLDHNARNYVESELANIKDLVAVNNDIPGARI